MKKVKLSPDALRVESFPTAAIARETGTVHARGITPPRYSCDGTCNESCTCPIASNCDWSCINC
ncbi:MAG TPA: hypothetical protein VFJ16_01800 [Longimicrobium sp.]|nr:hypothetical protein [Longimicrobium sp.]